MTENANHLVREWPKSTIGEIAEIHMGQSPPSQSYNSIGEGLPFFQGKVDFGIRYPIPSKWCTAPIKLAYKNDILISVRAPVGDINLAKEKCCIGRGLAAIHCKTSICPHYLFFNLMGQKGQIEQYGTGSTFKSISKKVVENFQVFVPPIPEQKKIAAILLKLQHAIETQDNIIQSLCNLKKSTMQHLFAHGIHGEKTKMTELGKIPESWEVKPFIKFAELQRGFDITKSQQRLGTVPVVSSGGIRSYHDKSMAKAPGVIIGRKGSLGTVYFLKTDYWPHDTSLWVRDFKGNFPLYVYYYFFTLRFERFDSGASNPTLNRNTVHKELVAVPPLPEQIRIANSLQKLDECIDVHESKRTLNQSLLCTTLNKLISGKLKAMDLDIDVNEVE